MTGYQGNFKQKKERPVEFYPHRPFQSESICLLYFRHILGSDSTLPKRQLIYLINNYINWNINRNFFTVYSLSSCKYNNWIFTSTSSIATSSRIKAFACSLDKVSRSTSTVLPSRSNTSFETFNSSRLEKKPVPLRSALNVPALTVIVSSSKVPKGLFPSAAAAKNASLATTSSSTTGSTGSTSTLFPSYTTYNMAFVSGLHCTSDFHRIRRSINSSIISLKCNLK